MTQGEAPPDPAEAWVKLLGVSETPADCVGKTVARVDEFAAHRDTYECSFKVPAYLLTFTDGSRVLLADDEADPVRIDDGAEFLTADERRRLAVARAAFDAYDREKEAAWRAAREATEREVYERLKVKFEGRC